MGIRHPENPDTALPHIRTAETLLGVPLSPEGIEVPYGDDSIRRFAYNSVLVSLRRRHGAAALEQEPSDSMIESFRSEPEFQRLAAQVQAANDTLVHWHNPPAMPTGADSNETPRGRFQSSALHTMVDHAQRAPDPTRDFQSNPYRDGLLTVAPPGAGKSVLQALGVNYAGVGLPVSESDPRRRTAVGILNSRVLINQGLDPSETLHQFAGVGGRDLRIGAYFEGRHDGHDEYDLLLTTPRSYESAVLSGAINSQTTVRYILDEAHRVALAPSMQQHVAEFGAGLYMYTATPAIAGGRRDLRRQFPHSQFGSMREFVEDGILSPVQLFTYRAGPESGSSERLAISLAADYVKSGRKTLIVCQPGNQLEQAREIAKHINIQYRRGVITPHSRFTECDPEMLACAVGTYPGADTKLDLELLRQGRRLIATTVATGNEGLNIPDLDALIIIGPQGATWVVEQWLGRILRPSGQMAVASEILPHDLREGKPLASIFGPFGLQNEVITAGYYIGPKLVEDEVADATPGRVRLTPPSQLPQLAGAAPSTTGSWSNGSSEPHLSPYTPPLEVQDSLVTGISVREATIAPADIAKIPPPEYAPLLDFAPDGVPVEWLHAILDKLDDPNIRYIGTWQPDAMGEMQYFRYYSPAAHAYFEQNPVPELSDGSEFLDEDIASLLGVSRNYVRGILERNNIKPLERITKYHRNPNYYGMDTLMFVAAEAAKIPVADETDIAIADLGREISDDYVKYFVKSPKHGITAVYKRRNPAWGVMGSALHITGDEAQRIRRAYIALEVTDPATRMGLGEIAQRAGVSLSTAWNKWNALAEDEKPREYWLRSGPKTRGSLFFDREWGEAFIEYIKPEKVLPWEATLSMVALYFGKQKLNMRNIINRRDTMPQSQSLALPGVSETVIYPLSVIPALRKDGLEPAEDAPHFDERRAALRPEDTNSPLKVAYSQDIQRMYISQEQLPDSAAEIIYYANRRERPPKPPKPVREPEAHPEPPAAVPEGAPSLAAETETPAPPVVEPEDEALALTLEEVRARVDFSPSAFSFVLGRISFSEEEALTNGSGEVTALHKSGLEKLYATCSTIAIPPADWSSVKMVAHAAGRTTKEMVVEAITAIEAERGRAMGEDEVRLCRSGSEVDLYFSNQAKREIRRFVLTA